MSAAVLLFSGLDISPSLSPFASPPSSGGQVQSLVKEKLQQCAIHTMRRRLGSYSHAEARRRRGCLDRINGMNSWNVANVEVLPVANANCVVGCQISTRPNESTIKMFRCGAPAKFPFAPPNPHPVVSKKILKSCQFAERRCSNQIKGHVRLT